MEVSKRIRSVKMGARTAGILFAVSGLLGLTIAAPGAASASTQPKRDGPHVIPHITVGDPVGVTTLHAGMYLAQVLGYFTQRGVDVTVENLGATDGAAVAAGEVTMTAYSATAAFAASLAGHQMSIIDWFDTNSNGGVVVPANSSLKPASTGLKTLMELAGKKVGVLGFGNAAYGTATSVNHYIESHSGQPMTLVSLSSAAAIGAELVSGQLDAAMGASDNFPSYIANGQVRVLIKGNDPSLAPVVGTKNLVTSVIYGLKSVLQAHKAAVVRFLEAFMEGQAYLHAHNNRDVAATMVQSPVDNGLTFPALLSTVPLDRPFQRYTDCGYISKANWQDTLGDVADWGLGLNLQASQLSYSQIVDMSYLKAAQKVVTSCE